MMKIEMLDESREGEEIFKNFDMAAYAKAMFGSIRAIKKKYIFSFLIVCVVCLSIALEKILPSDRSMQSTANVRWMSMSVRSSSGGYSVLEKM